MRTRLLLPCLVVPALLALPAPARAQNNTDRQIMADMRMLHEELQQARLLIATLADQLKATTARLDAVEQTVVKGFANQKLDIDEMTSTTTRLSDKVSENSVRVGQFASELTSIREGIGISNTMLNQILQLIQPPPTMIDPATGEPVLPTNPANPTGPPPPTPLPSLTTPPAGAAQAAPGTTPQSAIQAWNQANGLYYGGQYDLATEAYQNFVTNFPSDPNAPHALISMGLSYYTLGRYREALGAFGQVIQKYPTAEKVPEAHYNQGLCYQQLKDLPNARKAFQTAIDTAPPNSSVSLQAKQLLQKIGGID
ncbi:MAG: tetratricopeptide repeat protein [Vicinamibacterales bacterium]